VLLATIVGSSLSFIDGTAVNVALPALQRDLRATASDVQWVIEIYALFLSALILVGGSLGDQFGRRRVFAVGVGLFTVASMWCGLAPNLGQLIAARAIQGIGGALLVPGSLAIISASYDESHRGRAIGTWSGFATMTSALGPVLGGWLIQIVSWRAVFFINVPLAAVTLAVTAWRVPESRGPEATGPLDWRGAGLATFGLGAVVYGLIQSSTRGLTDPQVLSAMGAGLLALLLFVLVEARAAAPMMPLSLFQSRTFSGTNLMTFLLYGGLGGAFYFLPFNLQQVQGYSAVAAGAAMLPFPVIVFLLSRWSGGLLGKHGAKLPLVVGTVIAASGFALFAVPGVGGSYWTTYFPGVVVLGAGMALVIAPLSTAVMGAVDSERAGVASGINNAVSRAAGLLAIAVLGLLVAAAFNASLDGRLVAHHLGPALRHAVEARRARLAAAGAPAGVGSAVRLAVHQAVGAAYVAGFRLAMLTAAGLALAGACAAGWLVEGKGRGAQPV
jgi:EmrB/QacA subfamily drug resistance transporter